MDLRSLKMAQGFAKEVASIRDDGTVILPMTGNVLMNLHFIPPAVPQGRAIIVSPLPVVITNNNRILVEATSIIGEEYEKDIRGFTHPNLHRRIVDDIQEEYKLGVFGQNSIRFYDDHFQEDQLPDEVP